MQRILVTGGAGLLGQVIATHMSEEAELRALARREAPGYHATFLGSIEDPELVARAVEGTDAIVHLACRYADDVSFEETLDVNYRGTITLMDAAVAAGVRNVIFASSNHGWGFHPRSAAPLADSAPPRPDGWYGISKIWGEAVMAYYADAHGLVATSLRIGSCFAEVVDERQGHMWLGFGDFIQLLRIALARTDIGHRALHAVSDCPAPFFSNAEAKSLGFAPQQAPGDHLAAPDVMSAAPANDIFGRAIGGSFARANFKAQLNAWEAGK